MTRPDFTAKTKLAAWKRAGGPDDPRCECHMVPERGLFRHCGGQPITKADPPEYHHIDEAETGDRERDPERWAYLRSLDNCACVLRSCHRAITDQVTVPKVKKSRTQRQRQAGIKRQSRSSFATNRDGPLKKKLTGEVVKRCQ